MKPDAWKWSDQKEGEEYLANIFSNVNINSSFDSNFKSWNTHESAVLNDGVSSKGLQGCEDETWLSLMAVKRLQQQLKRSRWSNFLFRNIFSRLRWKQKVIHEKGK